MNKAKMVEAIRRDAVIVSGTLLATDYDKENPQCEKPGHCAVGGLLYFGGMENEELYYLSSDPDDWTECGPEERKAARILYELYGIEYLATVGTITELNDSMAEPGMGGHTQRIDAEGVCKLILSDDFKEVERGPTLVEIANDTYNHDDYY